MASREEEISVLYPYMWKRRWKPQRTMMRCNGTTYQGRHCRRMPQPESSYCACHSHQHDLYWPIDDSWPSIHTARGLVRVFGDKWVFLEYCKSITERFFCSTHDIFNLRLGFLICIELSLRNYDLVYNDDDFIPIKRGCIHFLSQYPFFAEYLKHFRRKVDKDYRKECQAAYTEKILKASQLDSGSISNILVHL